MPSTFDDIMPLTARPMIVAGPCSAESESQLLTAAHALAGGATNVFRASLWKPRTHPGSFEGVGEAGLPWLQQVKATCHLPVATEVATAAHVEAAITAGIDVLWIGARTTTNPFAVQQVAEALARTNSTTMVMVKNPVSPDLELWIGALQRFYQAGVRRLVAVHRGFTATTGRYRNDPKWHIPIELKRRYPTLPVLVDPSHLGGQRSLVASLSQQALDMGFDGLMIECHPTPSQALSDAEQQLTPAELHTLLDTLQMRNGNSNDCELTRLRQLIDECDDDMMAALARRMQVSRLIGQLKRRASMPVLQTDRFSQILATRTAQAADLQMSEQFVSDLLQLIHRESVAQQL